MAQKDVAKDIKSAADLEQQLLMSYTQKGVVVLDVYSSEWGPCKAISETFRRLYTEAADSVHLRFFTVECNQVLESLKNPLDNPRHGQRPKDTEAIKDALPDSWQPLLEKQRGRSRPNFLFYKEGKRHGSIDGVDTPAIRALVKDLSTVKTPAAEFITNPRLQEFWDDQFNPEESEVNFDKLLKGFIAYCKLSVAFNEDEKRVIQEAVGLNPAKKDRTVTADALQKWFGDDENNSIRQALRTLLPDYDSRAEALVAERQADEKRRQDEAEEAQRQEEAKKAEQERVQKERERNARESRLLELDTSIQKNLDLLGYATESDVQPASDEETVASAALETPDDAEAGAEVKVFVVDEDKAASTNKAVDDGAETAEAWLLETHSASLQRSSSAYDAASTPAIFWAKLLAATADQMKLATDASMSLRANWETIAEKAPSAVLAASNAREAPTTSSHYYALRTFDGTADVVLGPWSALQVAAEPPASGDFTEVTGLPAVIPLQSSSPVSADSGVAVLPWYATFTMEDGRLVFSQFLLSEGTSKLFNDDRQGASDKLAALPSLRKTIPERDELRGDEKPAEKKPQTKSPGTSQRKEDSTTKEEEEEKKDESQTEAEAEEKPTKAEEEEQQASTPDAPAASSDKQEDDAQEASTKEDSKAASTKSKGNEVEEAPRASSQNSAGSQSPNNGNTSQRQEEEEEAAGSSSKPDEGAAPEKQDSAAANEDGAAPEEEQDAAEGSTKQEDASEQPPPSEEKKDEEAPAAADEEPNQVEEETKKDEAEKKDEEEKPAEEEKKDEPEWMDE